jgi:hypothetical protein
MSYGETAFDAELKRAWEEFCDRIKSASSIVFRDTAPPTPLDRATGIQYLSRYISKALNQRLEFADPLYPQFWQLQTPTNKSFGDNPDCTYLVAPIDSEHSYRIVGNRGSVAWVSFIVRGVTPGSTVSAINNRDLKTQWDGSFEIIVSPHEQPPEKNWLKNGPGAHQLFVREFFGEWDTEEPMTIRVERIGQEEEGPPAPLTPQRLIRGLKETADWMIEDATRWVDWVDHYRDVPNRFVRTMPAWVGDGAQAAPGPDAAILPLAHPARRGAADRGHAAAMLLLELRAGELLVEFSGLPLPVLLLKRQAGRGGGRRFGTHRRVARGSGHSKLAGYRRPLRRDGESALGGIGGISDSQCYSDQSRRSRADAPFQRATHQ